MERVRRILVVSADEELVVELTAALPAGSQVVRARSFEEACRHLEIERGFAAIVADYALQEGRDSDEPHGQQGASLLVFANRVAPGTTRVLVKAPKLSFANAIVETGFAHAAFPSWGAKEVANAVLTPRRDITPVTKP